MGGHATAYAIPVSGQNGQRFDAADVLRGAQLAAIGNCNSCHTAEHGKAYAGGRPVPTPFGTIYATNITPDETTGIGKWSSADFLRAMHEGTDPKGRNLYPAFPYDHFTQVTNDDVALLYAFLMTREPVASAAPANKLVFPLNIRMTVSVWKSLFFKPGPYRMNASQTAQWNHGAYLVEGLAHCGACHTPRNLLGAEKKSLAYSGGEADGWHSPALNQASLAPSAWTAERLYAYLRTGMDDAHDAAAGPMADVVHNLATVPEEDVRAIAVYVASLSKNRAPPPLTADASAEARAADARAFAGGAGIYANACASCHDRGRQIPDGALNLALSTSVVMESPANLLHIVREGIMPRDGEQGPWMPAFKGSLTAGQTADLAVYLRAHFGARPAWANLDSEIRKAAQ